MTTRHPTGQLVPAADGHDLIITRTLPGSVEESWASITESERTERWIGRWEGAGALGETVKLQLGFEEGSPWADVRITECDAPHRLRVLTIDEGGSWDLSLDLAGIGERTELRFTMHRVDPSSVGEIGPGWEYYLDQLGASISGGPSPKFDDYFPAQQDYYVQQAHGRP